MELTGNENHTISLSAASQLTANFRQTASPDTILAGCFGKTAILAILNQPQAVGLRIYNAKTNQGQATFVLVAVNAAGDDLDNGEIAEFSHGCPPLCGKNSPLNS